MAEAIREDLANIATRHPARDPAGAVHRLDDADGVAEPVTALVCSTTPGFATGASPQDWAPANAPYPSDSVRSWPAPSPVNDDPCIIASVVGFSAASCSSVCGRLVVSPVA